MSIVSKVITEVITNVVTPVVGLGDEGVLSLFDYGEYTRYDIGYGITYNGSPVEVAQDVLPTDASVAPQQYVSYSGTNKCECDGLFATRTDGVNELTCDVSIVGEYCRLENNTGSNVYPYISGQVGNTNIHSWMVTARSSSGTAIAKLSGSATNKTISIDFSVISNIEVPTATTKTLSFLIPPGEWVEFQLPQLTETPYQLPTIVSSADGPVTVEQPYSWLYTQDINIRKSYHAQNSEYILCSASDKLSKSLPFSIAFTMRYADVTTGQIVLSNVISSSDLVSFYINSGSLRVGIYNGSSYFVSESTAISADTTYKVLMTFDGSTTLKLYLDNVEKTGTLGTVAALDAGFSMFAGTNGGALTQDGNIWDVQIYERVLDSGERASYQTGAAISNKLVWFVCAEDRYDKHVPDSSGNGNHCEVTNYSDTFRHTDTFGYPVSITARKPWVSNGVSYGLSGLFNGVSGGNSTGRAEIEGFKPSTVSVRQDLFVADDGTVIFYLDTDGYLKLTDGTNTATSSSALSADTSYDFSPRWNGDSLKMWITLDGVKGAEADFTGSFPDIGNRLFYSFEETDLHRVENVNFSNELPYDFVFHNGELVLHNGVPVIVYK